MTCFFVPDLKTQNHAVHYLEHKFSNYYLINFSSFTSKIEGALSFNIFKCTFINFDNFSLASQLHWMQKEMPRTNFAAEAFSFP